MLSSYIDILLPYRERIENQIQQHISSLGPKTLLRDACEYALMNGGKRFRPALVYMVADALDKGLDPSYSALAIEYFHCASLVVDDLPCMDNDDVRRGQPATHKKFGESTALLVSYALIAAGYEAIAKNSESFSGDVCRLAVECASYNTGLAGATGGQYLDVYPKDLSLEALREVLQKKTVSLFEISFVFGWLYGGGNQKELNQIKKAAEHFGMAFQIADDLGDQEQDTKNGRLVNFAVVFGETQAKELLKQEITAFLQIWKDLGLCEGTIPALVKSLNPD